MIRVQYTRKYSQDGYSHNEFSNSGTFGAWFIKNYKLIDIWEIIEN